MNAQQLRECLFPISEIVNGTACANCLAKKNLSACAACKHARYCSRTCQKEDWKEHKPKCKFLTKFHLRSKEIDEEIAPGIQPGVKGLRQKLAVMKKVNDIGTVDFGMVVPNKTWNVAQRYIQYCRCCSICKKTEYDIDPGLSNAWPHCRRCNFGWCCSEEHWNEYKSQHTRDICDTYIEFAKAERFSYQHMKKYGETFMHLPTSVCEEPLTVFPTSWREYFEIRDPQAYSQRRMLPKEFFPAATFQLAQPVNCLYGMYQHGIESFMKETLTIHVVGASPRFEMFGGGATCVWEEIMHCLPNVQTMNIVFVGPEACATLKGESQQFGPLQVDCCPECVSKNRTRSQAMFGATYHDFCTMECFSKPDFLVAFNTGMFEEYTESWKTSLNSILDLDVPCLFTSYCKSEGDADFAVLKQVGAHTLTDDPVLNPFPVDHPIIDVDELDNFFKISMYCVCFKGRGG